MDLYDVVIVRKTTVTDRARIQVEAGSKEEAAEKALDIQSEPSTTWSERFTEPARVNVIIDDVDILVEIED